MRALALLALAACMPAIGMAADTVHAGYRSLVSWQPGTDIRLDAAVWYPTRARPATVKAGIWTFSAARNAPPLPGPWPLLILSPDSSGSRFAHHDLAAALAGRGFLVLVPTHDGDNVDDMRFLYTNLHLPARARQLSAALDLVLKDPVLGGAVDTHKIGLVAFGGGGSAALLLAGAKLSPEPWASHCAPSTLPSTSDTPDPYCQPYMASRMEEITHGMRHQAATVMEARKLRDQAVESQAKAMTRARDAVSKSAARLRRGQRKPLADLPTPPVFSPLLPPLPAERPLSDSRFRAMMLISPGYSMLFAPDSLKSLSVPVSIVGLEREPLHTPEHQALVIREMLGSSECEYTLLTGADGPALQARCPEDMDQDLPDLCRTVTLSQRASLHRRLESLILGFFQRVFP